MYIYFFIAIGYLLLNGYSLWLKVKYLKISVCRFETKEHKHNSVRAVIDRKGL